jgi:hypothetical protein
MYLHPLFGSPHRLQVLRQHRRLDEVVGQKFNPAAATRRSLRHRRRADRLCVLDLGGSDSHLQGSPWRRGTRLSPGGLLDGFPLGLGGSFRSLRGLWCQLLHGHPCRDVISFSAYQHTTRASVPTTTHPGVLQLHDGYSPSTTTASGSGASVAGGSVAAWASGAASSTGGAVSSASAVEGSSPSQLRSVDFLQKYPQRVVRQIDYCNEYYS